MIAKERVEAVLDRVRPFLRADGGEIELLDERIAQTCSCGTVRVGCMSASILFRAGARPADSAPLAPSTGEPVSISLDARLRDVETNLIGWALRVSGGNKSRAAELLQIKRSTLGDRINRCGLNPAVKSDETQASSTAG
jgi:DNA-binding NtrC family response regulator